jgi:hypothetical protein
MATRKQRKRREKEQRHEYVWQDAEGNVIEPDEARKSDGGGSNGAGRKQTSSSQRGGGGRVVQPPSWHRTFKRALIFAPIFLIIVLLLNGGNLSLTGAILNAILLVAVFVPFSYLMDKIVYRQYQKRQAKRPGG